MKTVYFIIAVLMLLSCSHSRKAGSVTARHPSLPAALTGRFADDYGSTYLVTDTSLLQRPGNSYQLLLCDTLAKVIIARNAISNASEQGLYSRIDYMYFEGMSPWTWGYCLTVYNAATDSAALMAAPADRANPRKGCNGFPFTRLKRIP